VTRERKFECDENEVMEFLAARRKMLEAVVLSGGEPTLQKDLAEYMLRIKALGYKTKLDTNASNPKALENLIQNKAVDYIAVDIKTAFEKYGIVAGMMNVAGHIKESLRVIRESGIPYELRTTCVPGVVDTEDFEHIGKNLVMSDKYYLQQFRAVNTFDPKYADVKPYSKEKFEEFKQTLSKYTAQVETRGV